MCPSPPNPSQMLQRQAGTTLQHLFPRTHSCQQDVGPFLPSTEKASPQQGLSLFWLPGDSELPEIHFLSFPSCMLIILILWGLHFYYKLSQIIFYSRQSIKQQKWNITSLTRGWVSFKSSSPLCVATNVTAQTIPQSQNSEGPPDTSSGLLQTPTPDPPTLSMYQETSEAGLPIATWIEPPGVVQFSGAV